MASEQRVSTGRVRLTCLVPETRPGQPLAATHADNRMRYQRNGKPTCRGLAVAVRAADAFGVNVELLVIPDCPHRESAETVLRTALDDVGLARIPIRVTVVETQQDAESRHFLGSPTVLVDGCDPFARPGGAPALACRIYGHAAGAPDLRELRHALKRAAAEGVAG